MEGLIGIVVVTILLFLVVGAVGHILFGNSG